MAPLRLLFGLRSLLATLFFLVLTFIWGVAIIILVSLTGSRRIGDFFLHTWGVILCFVFNIKVKVSGEENLPKEGVLFVFNHASHFDIIIFCAAVPKSARFGAKIELFKIPIFSHAMRACGMLPIVRAARGQVLRLYDESIARVHAGESFILAAEGTRQPTPGVGERFKSGPFIFAINGQFPIVPVVIRGAAEILPKGKLTACTKSWQSKAVVKLLKPIPTKGLTLDDREKLQDEIKLLMTKAYKESDNEFDV